MPDASNRGEELMVPHTGVLIDLADEQAVAGTYRDLKDLGDRIAAAQRDLRRALAELSALKGTKTLYVEGVGKVELSGDTEVEYDAREVEEGLRALGCPEETIREIVVETVSYKVDGNRAKRAAAANPEYARVIEAARSVREKLPYVRIS